MPQLIIAQIAAWVTAAGAAIGGVTGAFMIMYSGAIAYGALVIGSVALSNSQKRRAQAKARAAFNASLKDREVMFRSAIAPRAIVYGRDKLSGPIIYAESTGTKKEFLHLVIKLADHECDAIEEIWFNDVKLPTPDASGFITSGEFAHAPTRTSAEGNRTSSASGTLTLIRAASRVLAVAQHLGGDGGVNNITGWSHTAGSSTITGLPPSMSELSVDYEWAESLPVVRVKKHLGAAGQVADADLVAESAGNWTTAHRGDGICYLYARLQFNQDVFGQIGIPNISCVLRGKKVLDPRTGFTQWSENTALCVADWLKNSEFGLNATAAQVPSSEVISAANICDEFVTLDAIGAIQRRYVTNGSFTTEQSPRDTLEDMLADMAGRAVWTQGRWLVRPGAYRTPGTAVTTASLAGSPQIVPKASRTELFNAVRVTYRDPDQDWAEVQAPLVTNATYEAQDGGVRIVRDIRMSSSMNALRAQRLGKIELERARQAVKVRLLTNLTAYNYAPTDTMPLTFSRYGWTAKDFEVQERTYDRAGTLSYVVQETAAAVYAWNFGEATVVDPAPDTNLPSPYTPPTAPTGLAVASGTTHLLREPDGGITTRAWVTWNASTAPFVQDGGRIEADWSVAGSNIWQATEPQPGNATGKYIGPLPDDRVIIVRVRAVNSAGRVGAYAYAVHQVIGKTALPANVAGFTATVEQGGVRFRVSANAELDKAALELHLEAVWNDATVPLFEGDVTDWLWRNPTLGTHTVLAKWRDTTRNRSATAASVTFTVDTWSQQQPGNNLLDPSQWVVGTTGTQGQSPRRFVQNGLTSENSVVTLTAPDGTSRPCWWSVSSEAFTGQEDPDGGWNTDAFSIDSARQYRFAVWVRPSGAMHGQIYLGPGQSNEIGGGVNGNPYFVGGLQRSGLVSGRWYLLVGYVFPSAYAGTQLALSGVYDGVTGLKIAAGTDYRWESGQTTTYHRAYQYYANAGAEQAFWQPRVDLCDGNEPTLGELLAVSMGTRFDSLRTTSLVARGNCEVFGNEARKSNGVNAWDSDVYSRDSFSGGAYASVRVTALSVTNCFFGLNSDPTTDQSYTSLDYAIQLHSSGAFIYENGANVGTSAIATDDVFAIVYDNATVRYMRNGAVIRTTPAPLNLNLFFDSAFHNVGSVLSNIQFGPINTRPRDGEIVNFRAAQTWDFIRSAEGWANLNQASLSAGTSTLIITSTGNDPSFASPVIAIVGALFDKIRVRVRRTGGSATSWDGTIYYSTSGHSFSGSFYKTVSLSPGAGFEVLEWDMANLTAGGADWTDSVITQIRLDLGVGAGDNFEVDWVSIGRSGSAGDPSEVVGITLVPGASGRGVVTGTTAVKLTSGGNWDWHVYSRQGYTRGVAAEAVPAQANAALIFGLNGSSDLLNESYTSIDYAIYCTASGTLEAYQSGTFQASIGTYVAGDALAVLYDGAAVRWVKNGVVLRSFTLVGSPLAFFFDSSFFDNGAALRSIQFGPLSGVFDVNTLQIAPDGATEVIQFTGTGPITTEPNLGPFNVDCELRVSAFLTQTIDPANVVQTNYYFQRFQFGPSGSLYEDQLVNEFQVDGGASEPSFRDTFVGVSKFRYLTSYGTLHFKLDYGLTGPLGPVLQTHDWRIIIEVIKR